MHDGELVQLRVFQPLEEARFLRQVQLFLFNGLISRVKILKLRYDHLDPIAVPLHDASNDIIFNVRCKVRRRNAFSRI